MGLRHGWLGWGVLLGLGAAAIAAPVAIADIEPYTTFLASGESEVYGGYLLAGEEIYASCDANCEDLDLFLYDAVTEEVVASDTELDAFPVVVAPYDGEFWVETVMVTCYTDVCEAWTDSDAGF
ncbi:MAG TPA: hypothetical protein V6D02_01175 [Candidatus Obscuribacterales bacterium]